MSAANGITIRKHPQRPPPPQDRGWSWMIVLGVFLYVFFMVGIAKSYGLFLLEFIRHFGVSVAVASMPISISGIVYAFGAPTALIVAEKYDARRVVIFGATVGLIGIAISSVLVSMGFVTVIFGISYGIGNSCFYGNGLVMIGKYFHKRRSFATGLGLAGASIGQFAMPPLIEYLLETYGLSGTLLIMAALYFHAAVSGALFRPLSDYGPPQSQAAEAPNAIKEAEEGGSKEKEGETKVFVRFSDDNGDIEGEVPADETALPASTSTTNGTVIQSNGDISLSANQHDAEDLPNIANGAAENASGAHAEDTKDRERDHPPDYNEICKDEEEEEEQGEDFAERKALFASTGSVFLVSHSVTDISVIDSTAHAVSQEPSPAQRRREKRKALCNAINDVFDFRLLRSYVTTFYTVSCFLCFFGYFNHILFLPGVLVDKGITKYDKALLISMCGAGDLISRISTGFFADLNIIPRYRISATACLLCGINIILTLPANTFGWLAVHCCLYGFFGGSYVSLLSVVLVDMVGLAMMSKNLAVILLIQGIGAAVGQIFMGSLKDLTGSFDVVIIICFLTLSLGGLMLFGYPLIRKWENERLARLGKSV
ncbi:hypothetical protein PoB_000046700 [Plakobranchus ocellatus]|uniref:Major facilitator superfamily (MFS) profile domain-containing protein n=1 Tax=Plakobranchus ocellatus TaxID=259542 RepID=A0AAV3XV15_9GAST|nr:hypothetical protein PoB_000046700 [Plakobranchus ocellatus]